jgi:Phosphotransferase enzyme family
MDFIHGMTYPKYKKTPSPAEITKLFELIAGAVRHIWNFTIPTVSSPGPFGQHEPADRFFSASGVGRTFDSITELQDFINETLAGEGKKWRVDFTLETLRLCHCDLAQHNLRITDNGVVYLLDFGMAGMYPTCFEEHALANQVGSDFARRLRVLLFGQKLSPNAVAMAYAARLLW